MVKEPFVKEDIPAERSLAETGHTPSEAKDSATAPVRPLRQVLALEAKLGCAIPIGQPIFPWAVEAVSDIMTKRMRGKDGRTAFERLYGKPLREEGLELGEKVLWKRPKPPGANALLERRWEEGEDTSPRQTDHNCTLVQEVQKRRWQEDVDTSPRQTDRP